MSLTDIGRCRVRTDAVRFEGHSPHVHDCPHLVYIVVGRGNLHVDGECIELAEGDGVWLPTGLEHALDLEDGGVVMGPLLSAAGEPVTRRARLIREPALRRFMATLLGVAPRSEEDIAVFRDALERVLHELSDEYFPLRVPVHPAARAIARDSVGSSTTLSELADGRYISVRHAQRLFVEQTGLPFATWRTRARLNTAIARIRAGYGIRDALAASGFATREGLLRALSRECEIPLDRLNGDLRAALSLEMS